MTVYSHCVNAVYELMIEPGHHHPDHPELFTELDVIALAAQRAGGFSPEQFKEALHEAPTALLKMFRRFEVARYGPVKPPGINEPDYLRLATKIVYAHPELSPKTVETPNGKFRRLMVWQGKNMVRSGRRRSARRDDFRPWSEQDFTLPKVAA